MMRALLVIVAVCGCKQSEPQPVPPPRPAVVADASASVATDAMAVGDATAIAPAGPCENVDLVLVSRILGDAAHPCRARVDVAYGRLVATGVAFSGTAVATTPARGGALFVTCQHCAGPDGDGLHDPETDEPSTFQTRAPAQLVNGKVTSGREGQLFFVHRVFSPQPPKSAFDARGHLAHIKPADDIVIGTVSGKPVEVVGHLGALPSSTVDDAKLALHDPQEIARSTRPWADAKPGTQALVLGFPRDLPDHVFGGELVASVGEILDDARAKDLLSRADADEAAIPYDPAVEMIVAARASAGMSGGGAFDEAGRYLGVAVRGTVSPVDGKYLVRVVRAPYVFGRLAKALAAAPAPLRAKLRPFVLP